MDWIKQNKFLSGFITIFILLFATSIFFINNFRNSFKKAKRHYNNVKSELIKLQTAPVFPSEENLNKRGGDLLKLEKSTDELEQSLLKKYNYDIGLISDTEFHKKLKQSATAIQIKASKQGVKLTTGFFMGMERYRDKLPTTLAAPKLDFQLDAISYLMNEIIKSGADAVYLNRTPSAEELKPGNKVENKYVEKYILDLKILSNQNALNNIINTLSNSKNFFFLIRFFKIENESMDGPLKLINPNGNSAKPNQASADNNTLDFSNSENIIISIGKEKLVTFIRVELIRFNPPNKEIKN